MQTFKQYLAEAGKGITREEAKSLLKRITSSLRPEMSQPNVQSNGPWWDLMIRDYTYFTPRPGEEDDDWPEFTGEKLLLKKLKPIMKGLDWTFSPEEKDWITISVKAKKLTKSQQKRDAKKKTSDVVGALEGESVDAQDSFWRTFYTNLIPEMHKWQLRKKFITKEQFMDMAAKVKWHDSDAAEEVWSMA